MLEDRAGKDIPYLAGDVDKSMDAARKHLQMPSINTTFLPIVPQLYARWIETRRSRKESSFQRFTKPYKPPWEVTSSTFAFNRFGRQWQVHCKLRATIEPGRRAWALLFTCVTTTAR